MIFLTLFAFVLAQSVAGEILTPYTNALDDAIWSNLVEGK
jgi:hypothetical protein